MSDPVSIAYNNPEHLLYPSTNETTTMKSSRWPDVDRGVEAVRVHYQALRTSQLSSATISTLPFNLATDKKRHAVMDQLCKCFRLSA